MSERQREQCESCGTSSAPLYTIHTSDDVEPFRVCARCAKVAQPLRLFAYGSLGADAPAGEVTR